MKRLLLGLGLLILRGILRLLSLLGLLALRSGVEAGGCTALTISGGAASLVLGTATRDAHGVGNNRGKRAFSRRASRATATLPADRDATCETLEVLGRDALTLALRVGVGRLCAGARALVKRHLTRDSL